jgi:hypothetical protein
MAVMATARSTGKNRLNAGRSSVPNPKPEYNVSAEAPNAVMPTMIYSIEDGSDVKSYGK